MTSPLPAHFALGEIAARKASTNLRDCADNLRAIKKQWPTDRDYSTEELAVFDRLIYDAAQGSKAMGRLADSIRAASRGLEEQKHGA